MKCLGRRSVLPFTLIVVVLAAMMPACENKEITQPDPQPSAVASDGKLEPLPNPIGRNPGPPAPGVGTPAGGASPSPAPGGGPISGGPPSTTPSPTPSPGSSDLVISVAISGPHSSDFEAVEIPETASRTVYKDETWTTTLGKGSVLIRTTNGRKGDLGNPQARLAITATAPVVALLVHDNPDAIGWDDAQGFEFIGQGLQLDTPTPANPGATNVFSVRSRTVGLSANITLGPNYEAPAPATCQADRACQPMYFLVITARDGGAGIGVRQGSVQGGYDRLR